MMFTIADLIENVSRNRPEDVAIEVIGGDALTYRDMWARVDALAEALLAHVNPYSDDRVAYLLPNIPDAVLMYLACQRIGVALVPVNTRLTASEAVYIMNNSAARVLVCVEETGAVAREVAGQSGSDLLDLADVPQRPSERTRFARGNGDRLAVVFYTSGTTGFPKGAAITNDCWMERALWWSLEFGLRSDDVMLVPGPIFHMGFGTLSLCALMLGARLRILPRFDAETACEEMGRTCTWALLIPTMTTMMLDHMNNSGRAPMLAARTILSSGAGLGVATIEAMMDAMPNATLLEGYGWTEGGWVTLERKVRGQIEAHCVGRVAFGSDVIILDEYDKPCPPGVAGEIAARSPIPFSHYLNNPEKTRESWMGEYLKSGDIGVFLEDGRLKLLDRRKDMIVTGGENVYSAEVERVLLEFDLLSEATVIGLPDETWGHIVVAACVAASGAEPTEDDIRAHCRRNLAGYKCPKQVHLLKTLPRNSMGKVEKFRVRDLLMETQSPFQGEDVR